jgi:hypothetical protein
MLRPGSSSNKHADCASADAPQLRAGPSCPGPNLPLSAEDVMLDLVAKIVRDALREPSLWVSSV